MCFLNQKFKDYSLLMEEYYEYAHYGNRLMNYSEAQIQIESIQITNGGIEIIGTVEGTPLVYRVDSSMKDYEKFLPDVANVESAAGNFLYELYINTQ